MSKRFTALAVLGVLSLAGCGPSEPKTAGAPVSAQRLSAAQYRQVISDVFAPDIKLGGRFEPGMRKNGLLAVGASAVAMSPSGFEQYDNMARSIAGQIVDAKHRDALIPCKPADAKKPDQACATATLTK
jgi:hypothetical protein